MAFNANEEIIAELFIAAYGRTPPQSGLDFWTNLLNTGARTADSIREEMMSNTEASIRYPDNQSNEDTITQVFENVLNRTPSTQAGLDWWTGRLDSGSLSMSDLVDEVLDSAKTNAGDDKDTLDNKLGAVEYYLTNSSASTMPDLSTISNDASTLRTIKISIDAEVVDAGYTPLDPADVPANVIPILEEVIKEITDESLDEFSFDFSNDFNYGDSSDILNDYSSYFDDNGFSSSYEGNIDYDLEDYFGNDFDDYASFFEDYDFNGDMDSIYQDLYGMSQSEVNDIYAYL